MPEGVLHLLGGGEVHPVGAVVGALHVDERPARGDALQDELGLGLGAAEVVAVVGGDDRQLEALREVDEDLVEGDLLGEAVVLELDEEVAGLEAVLEAAERVAPRGLSLHQDLLRHVAAHAGGGADDPLVVLAQDVEVDARAAPRLDPAAADQAHEVLVAVLAGREEHEVVLHPVLGPRAIARGERDLAAEDRLDLRGLARFVEAHRAVHVVVIGQRDGAHPELTDLLDQAVQPDRPIEHGELGVDVEVDELGRHGRGPIVHDHPRHGNATSSVPLPLPLPLPLPAPGLCRGTSKLGAPRACTGRRVRARYRAPARRGME